MSLNPKYSHEIVEKNRNSKWIERKYFSAHDKARPSYTIILPPPNVTGKLHLGHAWDGYIQDTIIRFKKLHGFDVMLVPGMDHAGIATQAKVEEKLWKEMRIKRNDITREKFLEYANAWKNEYSLAIRQQWNALGLGLDYPNERFTMDQQTSEAVLKVFVELYEKGMIYRGEKAINWDPALQTVVSDIEVEPRETTSIMYYFNYHLKTGGSIKIATVRPETMYSEVAIAVNPNDPKTKQLIGQKAISPLTKRELIIVGDDNIKPTKGTGAMKVSAHAIIDHEIMQRHNLPVIECIDKNGKMNSRAQEFAGLDRFEARTKIAEKLTPFIYKTEPIKNNVGHSQRSGVPVEILIMPQWFVQMAPLAERLLNHLDTDEKVQFYPNRFEATLRTWMNKVHDWSISRQLWWGHRIPAWYRNKEMRVQITSPGPDWAQDNDVLDTWFSSALAPFSFLGWPKNRETLEQRYPTSLLVTGYDIIFFWVARMYFMGLEFMNEKPFERVLIHGLIRGADGRKMSKSLGNGVDPMEIIEKYGSDALRFFLMNQSSPGLDLRFSQEKLEAAWNLNNKLWNIARYILEVMPRSAAAPNAADEWIRHKLKRLQKLIEKKIETYEFTIISKEITHFIVEDFSSWYIEFTKTVPNRRVALQILRDLLIIIHPFLPFTTDYLFEQINNEELLEHAWPEIATTKTQPEIEKIIKIVKALRSFRENKGISKTELITFAVVKTKLKPESLATITKMVHGQIGSAKGATLVAGKIEIIVNLSAEMQKSETERISKEIQRLESEIARSKNILKNKEFIRKAPPKKVEIEREKLSNYETELKNVLDKQKEGQ